MFNANDVSELSIIAALQLNSRNAELAQAGLDPKNKQNLYKYEVRLQHANQVLGTTLGSSK